MANSDTDLCNLALAHLGEAPIVDMGEDTASARACGLLYEPARDALLRAHRWNFATARLTLSRLAEAPPFGWAHQYELPADCLRLLEFNESAEGDWLSEEVTIEGRRLLSQAGVARIIYIRRVEDVGLYDPLFVEALACRVAILLSEAIRGTTGKTDELTQAFDRMLAPLARRVDANEGNRRKGLLPMNSLFVRARGES